MVNKQVMTSQHRTMTSGFVSTKLNADKRLCNRPVELSVGVDDGDVDEDEGGGAGGL